MKHPSDLHDSLSATTTASFDAEHGPYQEIQGVRPLESIRKTIPMPPFGKKRPRVTRNGTYMPREYEKAKKDLRLLFGPVPDGLVELSVTAVRPMPKSWSMKKRTEMRGQYAKPKPDLDNVLGGIMDALFTDDDVVVAFGPCAKVWGDEPQLIIEIRQVWHETD